MRAPDKRRDRLIYPVAFTILGGWAATLVYAVLTNNSLPLTITTPVMFPLIGYVLGVGIVRSALKREDD